MGKVILFSAPIPSVFEQIETNLFPKEVENKIFAYMPSEGDHPNNSKFLPIWEELAKKNNAEFLFVNNAIGVNEKEKEKIRHANALLITGGNTFALLKNLKESELFNEVRDFIKRKDSIYAGMSASAIICADSIRICTEKWSWGNDENEVGITDLSSLGVIDFEVLPHHEEVDNEKVKEYEKKYNTKVVTLTNEEFKVLDI